MNEAKVRISRIMLMYTYATLMLVAGCDKFFYYITNWSQYVNIAVINNFSLTVERTLQLVGGLEIVIGALILLKPRLGAYLAALWLVIISLNLISMGMFYDIAVRDLVMAVGALVLAWLIEAH